MKFWAAAVLGLLLPSLANAQCRQALVMALDVSSSVDEQEYALQMQGLAGALLDPEVQALLLAQPSAPIVLSVFEWSGRFDQRLIVHPLRLETTADLNQVAALLTNQTRPTITKPTAIGHALQFAGQLLAAGPDCWQLTIDISGDGKNNDGFAPQHAKQAEIYSDITVNGLVIGTDFPSPDRIVENEMSELTSYFRHVVIHGPNAFIETALGFEEFEVAMKRKLLRELSIAVADANLP